MIYRISTRINLFTLTILRWQFNACMSHTLRKSYKPILETYIFSSGSFKWINKNEVLKLSVHCNSETLKYEPQPKYVGVTLDRQLTFCKHLENTKVKVKTRNDILRKPTDTSWSSTAAALAQIYSVVEYAAPVWLNSCAIRNISMRN